MAAAARPEQEEDDLLDSIVMADVRFHGEGYQEGFAEGSHAGITEGKCYGALHGAKVGSEIGCYYGFACTWRSLLQKCASEKYSKKLKVLDALLGMIQNFPYEDPTYAKLHEDLDKIRSKFKQLCSLLCVHPDFGLCDKDSGLAF
ncbi:protein LTO1 homolog [Rhinatrema bivittatum]|uniref:protein LTO1 homolog n=1 Tax=Rhinatrema bivittatum TaxID=194408 RepID=UPI0011282959|nr:protein LTO1 homolog [Rhinatrema bivittatum]